MTEKNGKMINHGIYAIENHDLDRYSGDPEREDYEEEKKKEYKIKKDELKKLEEDHEKIITRGLELTVGYVFEITDNIYELGSGVDKPGLHYPLHNPIEIDQDAIMYKNQDYIGRKYNGLYPVGSKIKIKVPKKITPNDAQKNFYGDDYNFKSITVNGKKIAPTEENESSYKFTIELDIFKTIYINYSTI
ncbi:hypothetical protein JOC47_003061 [Halanaerobacter jeridensis]|uniref:Uncharacterized protein n=1 Tax=Halanaerobacter jeridensis TaxID=706427 RepID=A0A938XXP8_9FIRM|nr:hypothetical protein [Halanaerobacter jeridensis]